MPHQIFYNLSQHPHAAPEPAGEQPGNRGAGGYRDGAARTGTER